MQQAHAAVMCSCPHLGPAAAAVAAGYVSTPWAGAAAAAAALQQLHPTAGVSQPQQAASIQSTLAHTSSTGR
jgi:hypothetical protein